MRNFDSYFEEYEEFNTKRHCVARVRRSLGLYSKDEVNQLVAAARAEGISQALKDNAEEQAYISKLKAEWEERVRDLYLAQATITPEGILQCYIKVARGRCYHSTPQKEAIIREATRQMQAKIVTAVANFL